MNFSGTMCLNSKGYLDPSKPDNKTNQFGGTIGGPIKKDRTFVFGSYEGRRQVVGVTSDPVVVPSPAELGGDFSATGLTGSITNQTVANVLNGRPGCNVGASAGSSYATIFGGSQIPTACFDPVAASLLQLYVPAPNNPDDIFNTIPNVHQTVQDGNAQDDQFTVRVDHHLNPNQNLSFYYYFLDSRDSEPFTRFEALTPNLLEGFGNTSSTRSQQVNISHAWTLNNTSVNEFRFTYFRNSQGKFLHPSHTNLVTNSCSGSAVNECFNGNFDVPGIVTPNTKLGITPGLGPDHEGVPFITLSSAFTIGNDYEGELPQTGNTLQWTDSFTKVMGSHSIKFGGDVRRAMFDQTLYFDPNGDFSFFGGGPNDTGDLIANFLLGLPDSYLQGSTNSESIRNNALYLFAQDSWKVKHNITLNYGLRWELNTPLVDTGKKVQTFRPGAALDRLSVPAFGVEHYVVSEQFRYCQSRLQ